MDTQNYQRPEKPEKPKKSFLSILFNVLSVIGLILILFFGYKLLFTDTTNEDENPENQIQQEENQTTEVTVKEITVDPLSRINFSKVGTVSPYKSSTIVAEIAGTLVDFAFTEGDYIKKDDVFAKISDSANTKIAEINNQNAEKLVELAKQSVESTKNSANQDINSAIIGVETAQLRYEQSIDGYWSLRNSLEEQLRQTEIAVQAAQIGYQTAQENYFIAQTTSELSRNSALDGSMSGIASALSIVDNTIYVLYSIEDMENDVEDLEDDYFDVLDDYRDLEYTEDAYDIQNVLDDTIYLLDDTEDLIYDAKYDYEDEIIYEQESALNGFIANIDQTKAKLRLSYNQIDQTLVSTQIQPDSAFNGMQAAEQQLLAAKQAVNTAISAQYIQLENSVNGIDLAEKQLESALAQLENVKAKTDLSNIGAQTSLANAETQAKITAVNAENTEIKSPLTGYLLETYIDEGNYISPGQKIAKIGNMSKVKITVSLTADELTFVELGQEVTIEAPGDIKTKGNITKILPALDSSTKKIDIEIEIPNKDKKLLAGMFADVKFTEAQKDVSGIYVPFKSIIFETNSEYVYIVENNKAIKKQVELGQISGNEIEIIDGLSLGDKVITKGSKLVNEGDYVTELYN